MTMNRDVLRKLEVVSPCTVPWEGMRGDDRVRFCGQCRLRVYNLSGMSTREAVTLVEQREGRLCVRFHRRPDGTVVTRDCGALARRAAHVIFGAICTFIALVIAGTAAGFETWMTEVRWPKKGQLSLKEKAPEMGLSPLVLGQIAVPAAPPLR